MRKQLFALLVFSVLTTGCSHYSTYLEEQDVNTTNIAATLKKQGITSQEALSSASGLIHELAKPYKETLLKWADRGDAEAEYELGIHYLNGDPEEDIPQDSQKSLDWFNKSAKQGKAEAASVIASIYNPDLTPDGDGIANDYYKYWEWEKKAAELGGTYDMDSLVTHLWTGMDSNRTNAYAWAIVSETLGKGSLIESTSDMEKEMTDIEKKEGKRIAEDLLPKVRAARSNYCQRYPEITALFLRHVQGTKPCAE